MSFEFHYTTFIAKPAAEVWDALTKKEIIDQYYLDSITEEITFACGIQAPLAPP